MRKNSDLLFYSILSLMGNDAELVTFSKKLSLLTLLSFIHPLQLNNTEKKWEDRWICQIITKSVFPLGQKILKIKSVKKQELKLL